MQQSTRRVNYQYIATCAVAVCDSMSSPRLPTLLMVARSRQLAEGPSAVIGKLRFRGVNLFNAVTGRVVKERNKSGMWPPKTCFIIASRNKREYCATTKSGQLKLIQDAYRKLSPDKRLRLAARINRKQIALCRRLEVEEDIKAQAKLMWVFHNSSKRYGSQMHNFIRYWTVCNSSTKRAIKRTPLLLPWHLAMQDTWKSLTPDEQVAFSLRPGELASRERLRDNGSAAMFLRYVRKRWPQMSKDLSNGQKISTISKEWKSIGVEGRTAYLTTEFVSTFPLKAASRKW